MLRAYDAVNPYFQMSCTARGRWTTIRFVETWFRVEKKCAQALSFAYKDPAAIVGRLQNPTERHVNTVLHCKMYILLLIIILTSGWGAEGRRVAIVGSGVGASAAAFNLRKLLQNDVEIDV